MKLTPIATLALLTQAPCLAQWTIDTLPQARREMASTTVNGIVIFAGGLNNAIGASTWVDLYDSGTGTWSNATLSVARYAFAATSVGNKALFAGGFDGTATVDTVDIYDASTNTWTTAQLSQPRSSLAATTVGTKALFAGGYGEDTVDIYDDSTGLWSTALLSQQRGDLAATTVGDLAIFAGGWDTGSLADVDIYNDTSGMWTTATLSVARNRLAATTLGDEAIFAGGGSIGQGDSTAVDIYNRATNTWSTANLSEPREFLNATSVPGAALFAGGWNGVIGNTSNTADIYSNGVWTVSMITIGRWGLAATSHQNRAYFAGGSVSGTRVDIYTEVGPIGTSYCTPAFPNSSGAPASISASGTLFVGINDVTLTATDLPAGQFGYFLAGQTQGFFNPPGSQGFICLAGNIGRYNQVANIIQGPTGSLAIDLTAIPVNPPRAAVAGETWNFQCWFRDQNPTLTSNFTDGISLVLQ